MILETLRYRVKKWIEEHPYAEENFELKGGQPLKSKDKKKRNKTQDTLSLANAEISNKLAFVMPEASKKLLRKNTIT